MGIIWFLVHKEPDPLEKVSDDEEKFFIRQLGESIFSRGRIQYF